MKDFFKKIHSDNFKWYDFSLLTIAQTFLMMNVGQLAVAYVFIGILNVLSSGNPGIYLAEPFTFTMINYMVPIGTWILFVVYMLVVKPDKPILQKLGTKAKGNTIKLFVVGLVVGFLMNMTCAVVAMLNKDIAVYFDSVHPVKDILLFIAIFIQSSSEEMACRGFLYQKLRRSYRHPLVAILGSSVLFGLIHIFNPGVNALAIISIILVGLFCALIVYYFDSIWLAMAFHTAWNYTQSILLGLPNSGTVFAFSIFKLDVASARNSFFYDVAFGVEATGFVIVVEAVAIAIVWYLGHNKKKQAKEL